jgi:hypothetical protein
MAAWLPDGFCNFLLAKITKLIITQQPIKREKKMSADFESLEFQKKFNICLNKFKNDKI